MEDKNKPKKVLPRGQVNSSGINAKVLNDVIGGEVYEIVRNQQPWGVFLVRRPRTKAEAQALVEKLTDALTE